jgi:hypothetical protein
LTARDDLQCVIRQRSLQRLRFIPQRAQPDVALLALVRIAGIAFRVGSAAPLTVAKGLNVSFWGIVNL